MAQSPFATFLIIGPVCFFLGMLFMGFPYDYYILWASPPANALGVVDRTPYYDILESHLRFIHASPPLIDRILHIVVGTGIAGLMIKLYKPSEANMLFDGASLVLYMIGIIVYVANIVKGLRIVTEGVYGVDEDVDGYDIAVVGREDSLKVFAASNTILALVLIGVLVLQAGQWYAQRKENAELAAYEKRMAEKKAIKDSGAKSPSRGEKKKQ